MTPDAKDVLRDLRTTIRALQRELNAAPMPERTSPPDDVTDTYDKERWHERWYQRLGKATGLWGAAGRLDAVIDEIDAKVDALHAAGIAGAS